MKAAGAARERSTAAAVLAHPLRVEILALLNERDMSPVDFCGEGFAPAGMDVSQVADHFRELAEHGCLEAIEEDRRGDAIERVYRGVGRAYLADASWSALEPGERLPISRALIRGLGAKVEDALSAATFDSREDRHLSWVGMKLDERGWKELTTALAATLGEVEQIRVDAERRLAETGGEPIPSTCAILGFESPSASDRRPPPSG